MRKQTLRGLRSLTVVSERRGGAGLVPLQTQATAQPVSACHRVGRTLWSPVGGGVSAPAPTWRGRATEQTGAQRSKPTGQPALDNSVA